MQIVDGRLRITNYDNPVRAVSHPANKQYRPLHYNATNNSEIYMRMAVYVKKHITLTALLKQIILHTIPHSSTERSEC